MADLVFKQVVAVIDNRTTMTCLRAAGQIAKVDEPFEVLTGNHDHPPFHWGCRSTVAPWVPGMINEQKALANEEIKKRPRSERRFGPDGYEGKIPGVPPPPPRPPQLPAPLSEWMTKGTWMAEISSDEIKRLAELRELMLSPDKETRLDALRMWGKIREGHMGPDYDVGFDNEFRDLFIEFMDWDPTEAVGNAAVKNVSFAEKVYGDMPAPYLDRQSAMSGMYDVTANREKFAALGEAHEQVAEVVERWTGSMSQIMDVRKDIAEGKYALFQEVLQNAPQSHPTLYRGIFATDMDYEMLIRNAKVGTRIDLGDIASFSSDRRHSLSFVQHAEASNMLIEVENGPALPVSSLANTPMELEWFMSGKLEVTEVVERRTWFNEDVEEDVTEVVVKARWVEP